ncbi:unnamed protein product [Peniophora sp. CBMAI 1063]|nr:unnamed protein product [Peniophora sp. CBMAI 1063]
MPKYTGSCYCRAITYEWTLESPEDARTSICHCKNCKESFALLTGVSKEHAADNGTGTVIHREFCDSCGSFILEYGEPVRDKFRYIVTGSLDDPDALPPKGEFFCKSRASWMPEVPNVFHKEEVKE